jgi:hypothetical protein
LSSNWSAAAEFQSDIAAAWKRVNEPTSATSVRTLWWA